MALTRIELGLAMILVMTNLCHRATAQSGCTSVLVGLAPCLNYITGNSSTPSSSCCSRLSSVVQSQPQCLCVALNDGGSSLNINVNKTLALSLPDACNVKTPPISQCNDKNAGDGTGATPAENPPSDSSDDDPETPNASSMPTFPSGTGSKTTEGSISSGSITTIPFQLTSLFILFLVSCFSG